MLSFSETGLLLMNMLFRRKGYFYTRKDTGVLQDKAWNKSGMIIWDGTSTVEMGLSKLLVGFLTYFTNTLIILVLTIVAAPLQTIIKQLSFSIVSEVEVF